MNTAIFHRPSRTTRGEKPPLIERMSGYTGWKRVGMGILTALASYGLLGTVSAIWENPLFIRMTPVVGFEYFLLGALSFLCGLYVAIRRPFCSNKPAGAGSILGLLGVACPTCNKVLLLLFGGEFLLAYFEPIRLHVGVAGVVIMSAVVVREIYLRRSMAGAPSPQN